MTTNNTGHDEELKKSQEKYRDLFENAVVGMYRTKLDGSGVLEVNQPLCDIFGCTREEILAKPATIRWADPKAREKVVILLKKDGFINNYEVDFIAINGDIKHCIVSMRLYPQEGHIEGSAIDITDRKRTEAALQQSEDRYRTLVENASDIVFRTDITGHFTFGNPVALRITGYREEELRGKHYRKLIRPDMLDETIKLLVSQYENRVPNTYHEFPIITKDGHEKWLGQNTQLIVKDGNVVGFQAVARDITERKLAAEERLRREKLQGIVEVAGTICHEMNQPMQIISGNIDLLMLGATGNEKEYAKLNLIKEQIQRVKAISNKLMMITEDYYKTIDYLGLSRIIDIGTIPNESE